MGNIIVTRTNGGRTILTQAEALEVFFTLTDAAVMPFDRDVVYEQIAKTLGIDIDD